VLQADSSSLETVNDLDLLALLEFVDNQHPVVSPSLEALALHVRLLNHLQDVLDVQHVLLADLASGVLLHCSYILKAPGGQLNAYKWNPSLPAPASYHAERGSGFVWVSLGFKGKELARVESQY
jgi:hypothetical protein